MMMMITMMTQSKHYIVNASSWQAAEIAHLWTLVTNTFLFNDGDSDNDDDDGGDDDDDDVDDGDGDVGLAL